MIYKLEMKGLSLKLIEFNPVTNWLEHKVEIGIMLYCWLSPTSFLHYTLY